MRTRTPGEGFVTFRSYASSNEPPSGKTGVLWSAATVGVFVCLVAGRDECRDEMRVDGVFARAWHTHTHTHDGEAFFLVRIFAWKTRPFMLVEGSSIDVVFWVSRPVCLLATPCPCSFQIQAEQRFSRPMLSTTIKHSCCMPSRLFSFGADR